MYRSIIRKYSESNPIIPVGLYTVVLQIVNEDTMSPLEGPQRLWVECSRSNPLYFEDFTEILHYSTNKITPLIYMDNLRATKLTDELFS